MAKWLFLIVLFIVALMGLISHAWLDFGVFFVLEAVVNMKTVLVAAADVIGIAVLAGATVLVVCNGPD